MEEYGDEEFARELYDKVLRSANYFLTNAKRFEIRILQDHKPSYEEVAKIMRQLADMVHELMDDVDPHMAHQAIEYTTIMEQMALAIREENREKLDELTRTLDAKPFVAY